MKTFTTVLAAASTAGLAALLLRMSLGRLRESRAGETPTAALRRRRLLQMSLAVSLLAILVATRGGWPVAVAALAVVWANAVYFLRRFRD